MKTTQAERIEHHLEYLLEHGEVDLDLIYSAIVKYLGVPRPTVRRVARDYRLKLQNRCKILNANCEYPMIEN